MLRSFGDAASVVAEAAREGDMILTLGAGSVSQLGPMIVEKLQERTTPQESDARAGFQPIV